MMKKTIEGSADKVQPIVMAVTLDIVNRTERVLIGPVSEVRKKLEGKEVQNVIYDEERRLGQLIFDFEEQNITDWKNNFLFPMHQALWDNCAKEVWDGPLWDLMIETMGSNNAISIYTAYNAILYYGVERAVPLRKRSFDIFERKMMDLVSPYRGALLDANEECVLSCAQKKIRDTIKPWRYSAELDVRIWYPWNRCDMEVAVADHNLLPMINYYLHRLKDSGCGLRTCDCCGRRFFAPSGHFGLCSDVCRAVQKRKNEKASDERGKVNQYDNIYKGSRQRMRRTLNKLKNRDGIPAMQIEEAEQAYKEIRDAAKERKKHIKTGEDINRFQDWLFRQERFLDGICGGTGC